VRPRPFGPVAPELVPLAGTVPDQRGNLITRMDERTYLQAAHSGGLRIIGNSQSTMRLSCEVCGAHAVHDRGQVGELAMCGTCGTYRRVLERRTRDIGASPERRVETRC
jgi:succinyl-CoA synthetase alpha subunit